MEKVKTNNMVRMTFRMYPEHHSKLRRLSYERYESINTIINEALEQYLEDIPNVEMKKPDFHIA